ncbi:hypothetical protein HYU14_05565 [Candidatus Woesearchaeota archaeon]|nr:hypothetical protein [Candidatus Woesearchaeota archaeon]
MIDLNDYVPLVFRVEKAPGYWQNFVGLFETEAHFGHRGAQITFDEHIERLKALGPLPGVVRGPTVSEAGVILSLYTRGDFEKFLASAGKTFGKGFLAEILGDKVSETYSQRLHWLREGLKGYSVDDSKLGIHEWSDQRLELKGELTPGLFGGKWMGQVQLTSESQPETYMTSKFRMPEVCAPGKVIKQGSLLHFALYGINSKPDPRLDKSLRKTISEDWGNIAFSFSEGFPQISFPAYAKSRAVIDLSHISPGNLEKALEQIVQESHQLTPA